MRAVVSNGRPSSSFLIGVLREPMCDTVARTGCRVARSSCEDFGGAANLPEVGIVNVPILRRVWRRSIAF